jgi:tetratricopeptide (TPR) repeat protein
MEHGGFHALGGVTSFKAVICILGVTFFSSAAKAQSSSSPKLTNLPGAAIRAYYRGKYLNVIKAYEAKEKEAALLSPEAKLYAASSFYALQDKDRAYALYREAFLERNPDQVDTRFVAEYGLLCLHAEDLNTAQRYLQNALSRVNGRGLHHTFLNSPGLD